MDRKFTTFLAPLPEVGGGAWGAIIDLVSSRFSFLLLSTVKFRNYEQ